MSNMKNGFSTLNRWLGKKNKDKNAPNGKLSKSSTNLSLSVSTTNINETSQLEYNRITPLPVVTSNAPFEQTFRITVLLPKDQLYVARLGARVPLSKLLELVCEHKQLDASKYEFRNPVDPSQNYSCDLTIGAVGLSEVRLCHKSEAYDNFNADEVIKLHRTSIIRDSLSSSEFSSRNSKHTTKTASPYSSSNSLNSMDSTGMNYTRTPVGPPPAMPTTAAPKMMAPPRKKRAAPRPPSQIVIPERSALVITNGGTPTPEPNDVASKDVMPMRKDFYVSTPNLPSSTSISNGYSVDCNGNSKTNHNQNDINEQDDDILTENQNDTQVEQKNTRNLYSCSVQNLTSMDVSQKFPEPSPRKRILQIKKKVAPAPPPRGSSYFDDSISIGSTTASTPETPMNTPATPETPSTPSLDHSALETSPSRVQPKATARETTSLPLKASTPVLATPETLENLEPIALDTPPNVPKPVPRITTAAHVGVAPADKESTQSNNVSKVMLNRTPTPEPRSLSTEPPDIANNMNNPLLLNDGNTSVEEDDNVSKQADSGIGEPVPSPIPESLPSESSAMDCKSSTFESSSDDDDMVKVYNFKLGKTVVNPIDEQHKTLEELNLLSADQPESVEHTPAPNTADVISETSSWNFQIPISPPPNFADQDKKAELLEVATRVSDAPITPKIKERPVLNFERIDTLTCTKTNDIPDCVAPPLKFAEHKVAPVASPATPMNDIVEELSTIINEKRIDSLIKKADETNEIKAAKPNTLSNFSITSIAQQSTKNVDKEIPTPNNRNTPSSPESDPNEEKLYRKRGSITNSANLRKSVTRSDSFHATMQSQKSTASVDMAQEHGNGLNSRSSSYLSLTKIEQNGLNLQRRRSSSELSIGESPSLQSLEIIKTILNSRKNSLNNSGSDGESKTASIEFLNRVETPTIAIVAELKPKSPTEQLELKKETAAKQELAEEQPKKDVPKIYRYSGPPSINFSTWNERPKAQVAIKNEGDYIFGGKNASNQNAAVTTAAMEITTGNMTARGYRASTPAEDFRDFKLRAEKRNAHNGEFKINVINSLETSLIQPPPVAPKPVSPTMRMGIPEKEFKVPITVKPLRDVTVESVELREKSRPTTVILTGAAAAEGGKTVETKTTRPLTQLNTATLPRSVNNRFSTPAPGPALLRSTSITQLETNKPKSTTPVETAAPFGQNTLRKTGFKEKILAKEEAEQTKCSVAQVTISNVGNSTKSRTSTNNQTQAQSQTQAHNQQFSHTTQKSPQTGKTLQSAKIELKLQQSTNVYANQSSSVVVVNVPTQVMPKTTPAAPPPPPSLKGVSTKSQFNGSGSISPMADPRNQLLEAIRSFKREEMKRS